MFSIWNYVCIFDLYYTAYNSKLSSSSDDFNRSFKTHDDTVDFYCNYSCFVIFLVSRPLVIFQLFSFFIQLQYTMFVPFLHDIV